MIAKNICTLALSSIVLVDGDVSIGTLLLLLRALVVYYYHILPKCNMQVHLASGRYWQRLHSLIVLTSVLDTRLFCCMNTNLYEPNTINKQDSLPRTSKKRLQLFDNLVCRSNSNKVVPIGTYTINYTISCKLQLCIFFIYILLYEWAVTSTNSNI